MLIAFDTAEIYVIIKYNVLLLIFFAVISKNGTF